MPKITDYSHVTGLAANSVFLVDAGTTNATRIVTAKTIADSLPNLMSSTIETRAQNTIDSNVATVSETKAYLGIG